MITRLRNLRSTNMQGQRKIHVDLETNSPPDTAKLVITIAGCESTPEMDVPVNSAEITHEYSHPCQGGRIVTVKETKSGLETEKYLYLDATQSS